MALSKDWREFLELLNSRGVDYVIVGAQSLTFHPHSGRDGIPGIWTFSCDLPGTTHSNFLKC